MEDIIHILQTGNYACVINNQNEVRTFSQRGVADLHNLLYHDSAFLNGSYVADKMVGKAAAALMILGGVKKLYTNIISSPALKLFSNTDIEVSYKEQVPFIVNRDQSDWCPLEKLCYQQDSVETILPLITNFINKIKTN
jgi:iron complex outermembrane receptor protein